MFVVVQFLIAVIVGLSYSTLEPRPTLYDPFLTPLLTLGGLFIVAVAEWFLFLRLRAFKRAKGLPLNKYLRKVHRTHWAIDIIVLAYYAAVIFLLHWPLVLEDLGISEWILIGKIGIFFPFLLALVLTWVFLHRIGMLGQRKSWSLRQYLSFQGRFFLMPIFPVLIFLTLTDLVQEIPFLKLYFESFPYFYWVAILVFFFVLYLISPFILRLLWKVKSLPPSPIRESLEEFSKKLAFKCRDILLWDTHSNVLNAAIIGVSGPLRYVILSDALISNIPENEVKAVFAHEVAHAKKGHTLLYFLFSVGYIFIFYTVERFLVLPLIEGEPHAEILSILSVLLFFLLYWVFIFGYLSRRFEREADIYGANAVGEARAFTSALENISHITGSARSITSWRHFSVENRVDFLHRAEQTPQVSVRFLRRLLHLKILFTLLVLVSIGFVVRDVLEFHPIGKAQLALTNKEYPEAEKTLREVIAKNEESFYKDDALYLLGESLAAQGKYVEALETFQEAKEKGLDEELVENRILEILLAAGKSALARGDGNEAETWLRGAVERLRGPLPSKYISLYRKIYYQLALAVYKVGRVKESSDLITKAWSIQRDPQLRGRWKAKDLETLGDINAYLNNSKSALKRYKEALKETGLTDKEKARIRRTIQSLEGGKRGAQK